MQDKHFEARSSFEIGAYRQDWSLSQYAGTRLDGTTSAKLYSCYQDNPALYFPSLVYDHKILLSSF
jgi:hypothetical protein